MTEQQTHATNGTEVTQDSVSTADKPMKRILLFRFANLGNYGSTMMALNTIAGITRHACELCEFYCPLSNPEDIEQLEQELGEGAWQVTHDRGPEADAASGVFSWGECPSCSPRVARACRKASWVTRAGHQYDALIVLGGDDLSEYYQKNVWTNFLFFLLASRRIPVILLGQSIGPFALRRNRFMAKRALARCQVHMRDAKTLEYLQEELGLKGAKISADLAWLDLPRQHDAQLTDDVATRYGLAPQQYASIVISGLVGHYCANKEEYIERWVTILNSLLARPDLEVKSLCLLPHTIAAPHGDERILLRAVTERLTVKDRERVVLVEDILHPARTRLLLGGGLFTITGRMHAAVSTFQMGRPAISLAYSVKYKGVIGESLGRPDTIIEARPEIWQDGSIVQAIGDKVRYVLANEGRLSKEIRSSVEELKSKAEASLEEAAARIVRK